MRLPQYRADIVAILTMTAALLPSLISTPAHLFDVQLHESSAFPIHRRASLLVKVAAVKCAPIEVLSKVNNLDSPKFLCLNILKTNFN